MAWILPFFIYVSSIFGGMLPCKENWILPKRWYPDTLSRAQRVQHHTHGTLMDLGHPILSEYHKQHYGWAAKLKKKLVWLVIPSDHCWDSLLKCMSMSIYTWHNVQMISMNQWKKRMKKPSFEASISAKDFISRDLFFMFQGFDPQYFEQRQ